MKRLPKLRPSPAMVVACVALIVALGGTSVAAIQALPNNSVGTKQIKNGAVTGAKVRAHTLNATKLAPSVLSRYFNKSQTLSGFFTKAQVNANNYTKVQADARYLRGTITVVGSATVPIGGTNTARATCPTGYQAIGGGAGSTETGDMYITSSGPLWEGGVELSATLNGQHLPARGWSASAVNSGSAHPVVLKVAVICSPIAIPAE